MSARPAYSREDVEQAREMARAIVAHYFGTPARRLRHRGSGLSNTVFEVDNADGQFVVRIAPDEARLPVFLKEQWSIARAREAGVPVPEVMEVGQRAAPRPYMIQRRLAGEPAMHHPSRIETLREVGRLARVINDIPTNGFGEVFDWCDDRRREHATLAAYLEREYRWRERLAVLERHDMLSARQVSTLTRAIGQLASRRCGPRLAHGDLRLKNVLVDGEGAVVAIIDWDNCSGAPAPAWDLAVALHDLAIDAKEALIAGYGLGRDEVQEMAPALKALNLLHYATWVERSAGEGDACALERFRLRLSGNLDLYAT